MIVSFGDDDTELLASGLRVLRFQHFEDVARRRLRQLHAARALNDLMIPRGNRLEKLKGRFSDYYSIRINDQWRIIFRWEAPTAINVTIVDYH